MSHTSVYDMILEELRSGELKEREAKILQLLLDHRQGLTRQELVSAIDGYWPQNINNDHADRKNRKAIAALRDRLMPITATSGEAGYCLDAIPEALEAMRAEMMHRRDECQGKIERIGQMLHKLKWKNNLEPPAVVQTRVEREFQDDGPQQLRLI